jgi:2-phospho-L-lactate transferase/gluconeogenesis factor (CofD/UPF0052 family)
MKVLGIEFMSMLSSKKDVRVEYENSDELKRLREAYILHVLDYVVKDRERVHHNDKARDEETNKDKVTLDNVFQLAKQ